MLCLGHFDVSHCDLSHLCVLKLQRHRFSTWKRTNSFQKLLFKIISLEFFQKEVSFEAVVHLGLAIKQSVCYADNWVIEAEGIWINICCQGGRDEDFLLMFDIEYKLLFNKTLLQQNSFDIEYINKLAYTEHKLYFVKFIFDDLLVVLVF